MITKSSIVKIWIYNPRLGIKENRGVLQCVYGRWVPACQRIILHFLQGSSHIQVVPGLIRHCKKPCDNGGTPKIRAHGSARILVCGGVSETDGRVYRVSWVGGLFAWNFKVARSAVLQGCGEKDSVKHACRCVSESLLAYSLNIPPAKNRALNNTVHFHWH